MVILTLYIAICVIYVTVVKGQGQLPVYPANQYHTHKWGQIVSRTAAFVPAAISTPMKGQTEGGSFTFVVIGANTGTNDNDPLWRHMSQLKDTTYSVFVEPIPVIFNELQQNMKNSGMKKSTCVNVAISPSEANLTLYCTGLHKDGTVATEAGFSHWAKQTCTTSLNNLYKHQFNTREIVDKYMMVYNVLGMSVKRLLDTYATNAPVKIIQIDVEGLDDMVSEIIIKTCE
jgi:FkbM family methyltransferase